MDVGNPLTKIRNFDDGIIWGRYVHKSDHVNSLEDMVDKNTRNEIKLI